MGLEAVELVLDVEDRFAVSIADAEAGQVRTVGDLYQLVLAKAKRPDDGCCLTAIVFHRLRRALASCCGVRSAEIRPATPLDGLLPRGKAARRWRALERSLRLRLPPLQTGTQRLLDLIAGLMIPGGLFLFFYGATLRPESPGLPPSLWIAVALILGAPLPAIVGRLFYSAPASRVARSVGELSALVLALNPRKLHGPTEGISPRDAWLVLCGLIAESGCCRPDEIKLDTRFVEDLHFG
jgi:hypothetical protein